MQLVPSAPCPCVGAVDCMQQFPCAWRSRVILPSARVRFGRGSTGGAANEERKESTGRTRCRMHARALPVAAPPRREPLTPICGLFANTARQRLSES
jgi:hypothetical protein